ncbi:phosphate-binding protein [Halobacteriales archaeon QH_7_69_31]|nr:MAG: phosphate-binding protein [Halobacteriales archaeon QH_7_69_31]
MADSHFDGLTRRNALKTLGGAGAVAVAGCTSEGGNGNGNGGGNGNGNSTENGDMQLSGSVRVSGSSTVFPIAQEVGRKFASEQNGVHPEVNFELSKDGSGGGFRNVFIPCEDNGITPIGFQIAQDALTIVVNNDNDWVDSMAVETIGEIWSPDTKPETWADVNSEWPDEPFDLYGAATTSGTFDYFTEAVVGEDGKIREDYEGTERDDQIANGVSRNQYAFGYLPFAYYTNNPDSVKALDVSEGDGEGVEPSLEAAQSGDYPLARPLFFYVNDNKLGEKATLQEFCKFYIEQSGEQYIASDIGYVPSSDSRVRDNLDTLDTEISELS